jgi:hypothetical protein
MILYGCDSKNSVKATRRGLEAGLRGIRPYMKMLGLNMSRLIVQKNIFANEVYLPMEGGCQDPVYNSFPILEMRNGFLTSIGLQPFAMYTGEQRPVMLLIRRSAFSMSTRNFADGVRQWSDKFTARLHTALEMKFPTYEVILFSDKDTEVMNCLACQIRKFYEAEVVVGMHGAGLSNMIYMKPNSAIVEFAPYGNDGRVLLGGGPFNRASALLSHDYLIHYALKEEFKFHEQAASFNVDRFVTHIYSFLVSTGRITSS